jgi:SAM-dependent methyltransferase
MTEPAADEGTAGATSGPAGLTTPVSRGPEHRLRTRCRACGGQHFDRFLELGDMPLANSFLAGPEAFSSERRYPLDVYFCRDCSLVQLLDVIDPEVLFRDYIYVTGTSDTMAAHNARYARTVVEFLGLGAGDRVVEVASNDGSLLRQFQELGVGVLGVEPAVNIAAMAESNGVPTVNTFFDAATAAELKRKHGDARVIIGNNVLAHVDHTRDFLDGCRDLLAPDGLVIVEVPYVGEMLERLEYDTIYHEHLCYFSITALLRLFEEVGLSVVRLDRVPVHGGSLRVYAGHRERGDHAEAVREQVRREEENGIVDPDRYRRLARDGVGHRAALRELLDELRTSGGTLAGYGAPAKGNTLLNYCGIDRDIIPFIADRSPLKVGKYTPGTHIPVLPPSALLERQPDFTLILAWNFAREIMDQQREYAEAGGRFIIPIPKPGLLET